MNQNIEESKKKHIFPDELFYRVFPFVIFCVSVI